MVRAICDQPPADDECLHRSFGEAAQLGFGLSVATQMGYDVARGRLDKTQHPFCTKFAAGDVRITCTTRMPSNADDISTPSHPCVLFGGARIGDPAFGFASAASAGLASTHANMPRPQSRITRDRSIALSYA